MASIIYEPLLEIRASRGTVLGYSKLLQDIQEPRNNPKIFLDMFLNDEVVARATDLIVENLIKNGYGFIGKNKKKLKAVIERFEELDFTNVIKNICYCLIIYGDSYLEKVFEDTKITELHSLESTEIKIKYADNGNIEGYVQKLVNAKGISEPLTGNEPIKWTTDEVSHIPLRQIGSSVYSFPPLENIAKAYTSKLFANDWILKALTNNPFRILWHLVGANETQRNMFRQQAIRSKQNPNMDMISYGGEKSKVQKEVVTVDMDPKILNIINHYREQVLMIFGVPQVWVGMIDGENRGVSESQIKPFETKIKVIQQLIEIKINKELMPQLGFGSIKFKFNNCSDLSRRSLLEDARIMKDIGGKPEEIISFLNKNGIVELTELQELELPQDKDSFPSRERENKNSKNMTTNIGADGVSKAGGKKIQEEREKGKR